MLKGFLHIDGIKSCLEQGINCWLSYAMSQPVSFDLAVIAIFVLQYAGILHIITFATYLVRMGKKLFTGGSLDNDNFEPNSGTDMLNVA